MFMIEEMGTPRNIIPFRPASVVPRPPIGDPDHDPGQGEPDEKEPLDLPEDPGPDYDEEEPIDPDKDGLVEPLEPDEEDEGPVAD
ncbi:hypothetical protein LU298_10325 [Komagataeibacter intermedius]|uniref:Uncharacterized protein n=2 Tax=Komagataeibacter intermedius TaxID=66229 RepID=A0A0C1RNY8_9PROT|nr:hypothetical protein [Komagataeibacter intermedius]KPH86042.1 hypothetical protein GLUCOINTEAF2_0200893 [Komagataeibacter intermedius AF2]KPH86384.1 hypothetical protein GLUCOINTEAF2_0200804 [Komagataeibacter intermedius AF2]MCF3636888.1 hypothetical protein [Komagataeibacter intermedius]GAN86516.1 hypothetical protein Gain_0031_011 [Komagataeibacter intermedius TF2]GBQ76317.1 hypothetical protein AA0521_2870 [Komagataeibacter intermedius NRIC 0521]